MKITDIFVLFILAVLAGTGIGGGGLPVVYLSLICGYSQNDSQALNLFFFIICALSSTVFRYKTEGTENIKKSLICSALAIPGVYLGSLIRQSVSEKELRVFFGSVLAITGLFILFGESVKKISAIIKEKRARRRGEKNRRRIEDK